MKCVQNMPCHIQSSLAFDEVKITGVMALSKAQLSQFQLLLDHHDLCGTVQERVTYMLSLNLLQRWLKKQDGQQLQRAGRDLFLFKQL